MDSVIENLLVSASVAGLRVSAECGRLVVRGPQRAERLAKMILRHKDAVLAHLRSEAGDNSRFEGVDPEHVLMPFGKHRGIPVADLEADYLDWLWQRCDKLPQHQRVEIAVGAMIHRTKTEAT